MATKNEKIELVKGGRNVNGVFQPNAPKPTTSSTAITAESLKPVTPISITPPKPSTTATGLAGQVTAQADQLDTFNQNLAKQREQAEATKTSSLADFTKQQAQQQGLETLTFNAEQAQGLQELDSELQDINNEIRAEERANELNLREIDKNLEGRSAQAIQDFKYQANKESAQLRADLSIIQLAKQGKYDSAKAIADRKAKMEFEKQNNILEAARTTYLENKELFTTAEQRQFESLSADRERQLAKEQADFKTLQDQKLASLRMASTNGAPVEVLRAIQTATTPEEVISAGGQYGSTDLLAREAQRASIANVYDQINSRAVSAREAALKAQQTATTEAEKVQAKRTADTEQALELFGLTTALANQPGLSSAVGLGFKKSLIGSIPFVSGEAISGSARADFEANAERVANLLTLDNLDLMSGVLSETDIKILETAGSNLRNFNQSEKQYKQEIERVNKVMQRTINNNGLTEEQAVFWGGLEPSDIETFNSLWETL